MKTVSYVLFSTINSDNSIDFFRAFSNTPSPSQSQGSDIWEMQPHRRATTKGNAGLPSPLSLKWFKRRKGS